MRDLVHFAAPVMVVIALYRARGGMKDLSSWPCLMFAVGFSSNALAVPLAILGYEPYGWMLDLPVTTTYGWIVVAAMASFWSGYLVVSRSVRNWRWIDSVPRLNIPTSKFAQALYVFSLAGGITSIVLSALGYYGYFTSEAVVYEPPVWLDITRFLITLQGGVLLFILWQEFRTGRPTPTAWLLASIWVVSGIVAGFKTQVIMAGFFVVIAAWLTRKLRWGHLAFLTGLLFFSYSIVEPLREIRNYSQNDNAVQGLGQLMSSGSTNQMTVEDVIEQIVRRADYGTTAVMSLAAAENGHLSYYEARLVQTYELIPLLAFVPRAVWPDKPLADLGRDLSIDLEDISTNSVTPSQAVGSYLWGGFLGVVFNNFLFGMAVTLCGALILRYGHEPLQYFPVLLCACILSLADTVMAYYYILGLRFLFATFCFYLLFGGMRRGRADRHVPLAAQRAGGRGR